MTSALLGFPLTHTTRSERASRYIVVIAWSAIVLGVIFRLWQLPTRAVFFDEGYTQMRVAGHTDGEMWRTLYDGNPRTARSLRSDATVTISTSSSSVMNSLVAEDAQHPPLFYFAELFFVKAFGNSLTTWRLLPAVFGILTIGAAYVFARTVFVNTSAALLTAAVIAVSPIERIYSDQAREYSLLVLLVVMATLVLVQTARANSVRGWLLYALLAAAGLYTSPLMGYIIIAHGVFTLGYRSRVRRTTVLAFCGSVAAAVICYAPWLWILATHREVIAKTNLWSADRWPFARLLAKWIFNTGSTFFDLEYIDIRWSVMFVAVAIVACLVIIRGFRAANTEARWCIGAAIVVPALLLALPDVVVGEHRSSVARYALPAFAMLSILTARGLVGRPIVTTVILGAGLCSSAIGLLHASWWDNDRNADDARIAQIINNVPRAQVISSIQPASVITLVRLLDDDVRVSLSGDLAKVKFSRTDPIFVLRPSAGDLAALQAKTGIAFVRVPFTPTITAHEIGTHIGDGGAINEQIFDLYRETVRNGRTRD